MSAQTSDLSYFSTNIKGDRIRKCLKGGDSISFSFVRRVTGTESKRSRNGTLKATRIESVKDVSATFTPKAHAVKLDKGRGYTVSGQVAFDDKTRKASLTYSSKSDVTMLTVEGL